MNVAFYGHVRQYHNLKSEINRNIHAVLESGQYVMGPMLERFEKELAEYHGMQFAIGVANGTDALWLSLLALGIGPGDECITTTNTFFATAEAIWIAGATAVFVDSDPRTNCLDPSKVEAAITPRTKALVPVHLYGQCADMRALRQIADRHNLLIVEDNAQGIGARGGGFRIGELSDTACTSFIIQKNLGCFGDGGAVLTNHKDVDRRIRATTGRTNDLATAWATTAVWTTCKPECSAPSCHTSTNGTPCAGSGPRATPLACATPLTSIFHTKHPVTTTSIIYMSSRRRGRSIAIHCWVS
jgi:dTDP-4-amino-4,6-dideoxygalactose transaminase